MRRCGIPFEAVADYVEGRAYEDTASQIREHLESGCRTCTDNVAWLKNATSTLHETARVTVPQPLLNRAYALFRERFRVPDRPSIFAFLQFDGRDRAAIALVGARSNAQEGFEQIYTTDEYDVDIFQEPTEAGMWYLIGQVLPKQVLPKEEDEKIVPQEIIITDADGKRTAMIPTQEAFHLPSLSTGVYEIRLRLPDEEIVIPAIEVGR